MPCDNGRKVSFMKVYRFSKGFFNRHVVAFYETGVLNEVRIFSVFYLHNHNHIWKFILIDIRDTDSHSLFQVSNLLLKNDSCKKPLSTL